MKIILINLINTVKEFRRRAARIQEKSGTPGLLKAVLAFSVYPFYKQTRYYLYKAPVRPGNLLSEARPKIDITRLTFQVVTSNQQANELEADGFSFRKYPTDFNNYLSFYTEWLDYGAIAFCTFVDKEFAAISWMIPSQRAQNLIKAPPLIVHYDKHEVLERGMWVNSKFRGMKLFRYNAHNRDRFLQQQGVTLIRTTVDTANNSGKGVEEALGATQYGKARALRVLWLKSWREYYFEE